MEWTLDQLPLGQEAVVLQMEEGGQFGRRMKEMGITEGVHICRKRQAPLGDPSVYMVRGSALAIRNTDAAPAFTAASTTARDSTSVMAEGTHSATRGFNSAFW